MNSIRISYTAMKKQYAVHSANLHVCFYTLNKHSPVSNVIQPQGHLLSTASLPITTNLSQNQLYVGTNIRIQFTCGAVCDRDTHKVFPQLPYFHIIDLTPLQLEAAMFTRRLALATGSNGYITSCKQAKSFIITLLLSLWQAY